MERVTLPAARDDLKFDHPLYGPCKWMRFERLTQQQKTQARALAAVKTGITTKLCLVAEKTGRVAMVKA
jgi:hypothetical protein